MKVCPSCSNEYDDTLSFCRVDGGRLEAKNSGTPCPQCGRDTEASKRFCPHCGASLVLRKQQEARKPEEPRITTPASQAEKKAPAFEQPVAKTVMEIKTDESPVQQLPPKISVPEKDEQPAEDFPAPDSLAMPIEQTLTERNKRVNSKWVFLATVLGVTSLLIGGAVYYAKERGMGIENILGKSSPSDDQPERTADITGRTAVAQVLPAEELGFSVQGPGALDTNRRDTLLSEKIESQLGRLRSLYQQKVQQKPDLMGTVTLQIAIDPSGQVTQVEERTSHINDGDFKQSVIQEVYKWRFPEASSGSVNVNYPLLFLPPGMDIATIVNWERANGLRVLEPYSGPSVGGSASGQTPNPIPPATKPPITVGSQTPQALQPYEVLYPTSVYREPREDSPQVATIAAGTKVNVAGVRGEWIEVRSKRGNPPGYIKKDSAAPWGNR